MKGRPIRAFSSLMEAHAQTSWYHGAMISFKQYIDIINAFDDGELEQHEYMHIPYITYGAGEIKLIDTGFIEYITKEEGDGTIQAYVYHKIYSRIFHKNEFHDHSTQMVLRSTMERVIIAGESKSIWVRSDELKFSDVPFEHQRHENYAVSTKPM